MLNIFEILAGALEYLENDEGIEAHEVTEVEIEIFTLWKIQGCIITFPEWNYMCFTYSDWRPGDFIGYRTDECYYCGKQMEENHDCLKVEVA